MLKRIKVFFCDCIYTAYDLYSSILCHLSHSALTYASGVRLIQLVLEEPRPGVLARVGLGHTLCPTIQLCAAGCSCSPCTS